MTASAPTGDGARAGYRVLIFDFGGVVIDMGWDEMAKL